jgi:hypothetical protein
VCATIEFYFIRVSLQGKRVDDNGTRKDQEETWRASTLISLLYRRRVCRKNIEIKISRYCTIVFTAGSDTERLVRSESTYCGRMVARSEAISHWIEHGTGAIMMAKYEPLRE